MFEFKLARLYSRTGRLNQGFWIPVFNRANSDAFYVQKPTNAANRVDFEIVENLPPAYVDFLAGSRLGFPGNEHKVANIYNCGQLPSKAGDEACQVFFSGERFIVGGHTSFAQYASENRNALLKECEFDSPVGRQLSRFLEVNRYSPGEDFLVSLNSKMQSFLKKLPNYYLPQNQYSAR